MMVSLIVQQIGKREKVKTCYDITLMQTPEIGQHTGYREVFRLNIHANSHEEAIYEVFKTFNVKELMPRNTKARYIRTRDILLFDEGINGKTYYQLHPEGWVKIGRAHIK